MLTCFITAVIALVASFLLTPLAKYVAAKLGAMDIPNELSIHSSPTPRSGGLAMFVAFLLALCYGILASGSLSPGDERKLLGILIGGGLIGLIGFLGDRGTISTKVEFSLLVLPAMLIMLFGIRVQLVSMAYVSIPLTLFYLIGGSCAMNLLDGMDGLAASITAIASIFFAFVSLNHGNGLAAFLSVALFGAAVGFLPYNFHRANIFMGDVGSLFLGLMLSTVAVLLSRPYDLVSFAVPVLILGVPVGDTFAAVVRRAINRKGVLAGDRRHLYDLLRARGIGDKAIVLMISGLSVASGVTALLISQMDAFPAFFLTTAGFLVFCLAALWLGAFQAS
jgi:UDP-GlcNAc:undecaprenyl-phosphate GlcNAc-1-phosphate transferase